AAAEGADHRRAGYWQYQPEEFWREFRRDYAIWGISRGRTFDLSFGRRKDRSTGFPNWPRRWSDLRSTSLSRGSRPPPCRRGERRRKSRSSWPRREIPSVRGWSRAFLGRAEM